MRHVVATCLLALSALAAQAAPLKLIGEKSRIEFTFTQLGVPMQGRFAKFDAALDFDPRKPEATRANFSVDLNSVDLGAADYNAETRSPLWLNARMFPTARFTAQRVTAIAADRFEAQGNLEIKNISQPIKAQFSFTDGPQPIVEGRFVMKRLQWKIGDAEWRDTSVVADEVTVRFRFVVSR